MLRLCTIVMLLVVSLTARADFNTAVLHFASGKYEQAYLEMRSLAESSEHDLAMYYVGMMFSRGQGVEQNNEEAAKWLRRSAKKGVPNAQYHLANLYTKGQGVPKDYELAYAWYATAVTGGHKLSKNALTNTEQQLSSEELAEAQKLAGTFIEKYKKPEKEEGVVQQR